MSIRKPQAKLAEPNVVSLKARAIVHRVHDRNYGGNVFNPGKGSPTRFAPVYDAAGECVPSLYAAEALEAAIHETIFHDVPATAKRKTVPRTLVQSRAHARLEVLRDLRLASLRAPDLRRWRIGRNSLIASSAKLFPETARWASAIHHRFPDVQGLLWTSNQCDPDTAYLFFGDRVAPEDFRILNARDGLSDTTFLSDVRLAGLSCGIVITV